MKEAEKRAEMPEGTNRVLDRRTVYNSNRNLVELVKAGDDVLDVGCGSGSITKGIKDLVGERGSVTGIDVSGHLIKLAKHQYGNIDGLYFKCEDINCFCSENKFDVVTSARVLQWLSNPYEIILKMTGLLKDGGCLTILDYNHEKIEFSPALPEAMNLFYSAFLKWKKDAGMDLCIADNLAGMFKKAGLTNIEESDQSEITTDESLSFKEDAGIWSKVAETRGRQMVEDGYITDSQRVKAIEEYQEWLYGKGRSMKMYLKAVTAYKP